jgi:hypothetical protein
MHISISLNGSIRHDSGEIHSWLISAWPPSPPDGCNLSTPGLRMARQSANPQINWHSQNTVTVAVSSTVHNRVFLPAHRHLSICLNFQWCKPRFNMVQIWIWTSQAGVRRDRLGLSKYCFCLGGPPLPSLNPAQTVTGYSYIPTQYCLHHALSNAYPKLQENRLREGGNIKSARNMWQSAQKQLKAVMMYWTESSFLILYFRNRSQQTEFIYLMHLLLDEIEKE